ncbi:MAG TPA: hypothetical protein VK753_03180 [Xanthomonadaceae bacterium]|jgi:hypothetical protein|nr:hypothetical protein [Xanthomonadaceae bacterium]
MSRSIHPLPLLVVALLAGCSSAPPPAASGQADAPQATELRDTIQKPIDKAKSVEGIIQQSHDKQDSQLQDAEGGGSASPASPP